MNPYRALLERVGRTRAFAWFGRRVLTPLDLRFRGSRLAPSRLGSDLPLCYLTTIGRRSGQPRTVPLLYVPADDGGVVVVATNFGTAHHPAWSHNLEAAPNAVVEIDRRPMEVRARRLYGEERERFLREFASMWPAYDTYRQRTDRDVRLYVLEPR